MPGGLFLLLFSAAAEPPAPAVTISKRTPAYAYEFTWSQEARAIPALDKLLRDKARDSAVEFVASADEAYRAAKVDKDSWFPDAGYELNWSYETAGQSPRLLSLAGGWFTYTGGAHGIFGANTLLWDRATGQPIEIAQLFAKITEFALLHPAMCAALNKERAQKREGETLDTGFPGIDDAFNGCPKYEELTIWLGDEDRNGRFDRLNFAADPYVAGPYVEGSYEVALPVSQRLLDALAPEYRDSFEAQGRQ